MNDSFYLILHRLRQLKRRLQLLIVKFRKNLKRRKDVRFMNMLPMIAIDANKNVSIAAKTAFMIALADALKQKGLVPHVWSKGKNTRQIRLAIEGVKDGLSDDAFILSQNIPTWICSASENAMNAAFHEGATVLLLNGRAENFSFPAIFTIALVDISGTDVEAVLSGASFHKLSHADAIVLIGQNDTNQQVLTLLHRPIYYTAWKMQDNDIRKDQSILGFTGVNDSGTFYKMLLQEGYNVKGFIPLAHLNRYKEKQLNTLAQLAISEKSILVTSDKDIPFLPKKIRKQIKMFGMSLNVETGLVDEIIRVYNNSQSNDVLADINIKSA